MGNLQKLGLMSENEKSIVLNPFAQMELPFSDEPQQMESDINDRINAYTDNDNCLADSLIDDLPTLPAELSYHGFKYTRICRGVRSYVYQQTLGKETIGYELFIIRIQPEVVLYGKKYPPRERWPKDDDFSKTAWSFWTLDQAMLKFNALER